MFRSNDYIEKVGLYLREILQDFKGVYVTTENKDIDKILEKNKCVILLNQMPSNSYDRFLNEEINTVILHTGCYVIGSLEDRKFLIDILDYITQKLYDGKDLDDNEFNYINYNFGYESTPDTHNLIYFSGTLKILIEQ